MTLLAERWPVVDVDSHVLEPPDLWTSRLGARWGELVPHVYLDERYGMERWRVGEDRLHGVANFASAGWAEYPPKHPMLLAEADEAAWHPAARLARLDEFGIYAQVLYPNLLGFSIPAFLRLGDPALVLDTVRAYNDFLTEFASEDPRRLIPITALPFWDLDAALAEVRRCAAAGHKGILFSNAPDKIGLPALRSDHWEPLWHAAEDAGLSVNFHVGFQSFSEEELRAMMGKRLDRADFAKNSAMAFMSNANAIAEVIVSGLAHRHPGLNIVSVESGYGWLPFFVEALDWQWENSGARADYPERLWPSEYFRRQIHGSFWFERGALRSQIEAFPDNVMFETDFPHATSLSPGPASSSELPSVMIEKALEGLPEHLARKLLYENAARVYGLALDGDGDVVAKGEQT